MDEVSAQLSLCAQLYAALVVASGRSAVRGTGFAWVPPLFFTSIEQFSTWLCVIMNKKYEIQCAVRGCTTKKRQKESVPIHRFPERRCWTTMYRNWREILLVEVRISTSSEKAIFCLLSTFRWTILLSKEEWCLSLKVRFFQLHALKVRSSLRRKIFCISSGNKNANYRYFWFLLITTKLRFNYILCNTFKKPTYACMCPNKCTYNDSSYTQLYAAQAVIPERESWRPPP